MQNSYCGFAVRTLYLVQKAVQNNDKSDFHLANYIYKTNKLNHVTETLNSLEHLQGSKIFGPKWLKKNIKVDIRFALTKG